MPEECNTVSIEQSLGDPSFWRPGSCPGRTTAVENHYDSAWRLAKQKHICQQSDDSVRCLVGLRFT